MGPHLNHLASPALRAAHRNSGHAVSAGAETTLCFSPVQNVRSNCLQNDRSLRWAEDLVTISTSIDACLKFAYDLSAQVVQAA